MILDNEQQRQVLMAAINTMDVKGSAVEIVCAVKLAVLQASVLQDTPKAVGGKDEK